MRIITIANQKGGIGKTTTALCMASILEERGYKTLLIDMDPQCNATDVYGAKTEDEFTVYDLMEEKNTTSINEMIQTTDYGSIIPGDRMMSDAITTIQSKPNGMFFLKKGLKDLEGYDIVIIDSNPGMNYLLYNCLVASDEVIIPTSADRFGMIGLSQLKDTIESIQEYQNPNLIIRGILIVKYNNRTNLGKSVGEQLKEICDKMGIHLFKTGIRDTTKIKESQIVQQSILHYAPHCTASRDYQSTVDELIDLWDKEGE